MLGRHRNNYNQLQQVSLPLDAGRWHRLKVEMSGPTLKVYVDDSPRPAIAFTDTDHPLLEGAIGLRTWGSNVEFRNILVDGPPGPSTLPIEPDPKADGDVSATWDRVRTGESSAKFTWDADRPFNTSHSQAIEKTGGTGAVGIANRGLNRWGIAVGAGKEYAGRVYLRKEGFSGDVTVALQSADGSKVYAKGLIGAVGPLWSRHDFTLKSDTDDENARFALWIDEPGKIWVDQVFLSPTGADLFPGGPFRGDIARGIREQGISLMRYGGSMVNMPEYRWKAMIGDPDKRRQYRGMWYPWSTNGFGIEEFVKFCRSAGFEPVVSINIEESPRDAADLVEYLNGPITTEWGRKRAENGHPEPYNLKYLQVGNEETTNAHYIERFHLLHDAIRPKDANLALIIAAWWEPDNPISKRIVQELNGKAALWDVHIGGDDPREGGRVDALFTRMERLYQEWSPGTSMKACVFEENGGHHDLARALGHATVLNATQRHGDFVLIDCPANTIQAWLQNDNGWDQGQLFYTPGRTWAMPNYYSQQMAASAHLPCRVASTVNSPGNDLDLTATRDDAGSTVVLKVVNVGDRPHIAAIDIDGLGAIDAVAEETTLSGKLNDRNLPDFPERIRPRRSNLHHAGEHFVYEFAPTSYTVLKLKRR